MCCRKDLSQMLCRRCFDRADNRKTSHFMISERPRRGMEWAVKMKRSDSKFKSDTSLFCCSERILSSPCFYGLQAQFNRERKRSFAIRYSVDQLKSVKFRNHCHDMTAKFAFGCWALTTLCVTFFLVGRKHYHGISVWR